MKGSFPAICHKSCLSGHDNIADIWRLWKNAESNFVAITRELTGFVESARTADRQNKWMLGFGGFSFLAWAVLMGSIWSMQDSTNQRSPLPVADQGNNLKIMIVLGK